MDQVVTATTRFLLGTLLSSVGSMTCTVALVAYLLRIGQGLETVGAILGLSRIASALTSMAVARVADAWSPRAFVLSSEAAAALTTVAMLVTLPAQGEPVLAFGLAYAFRTCIVGAQAGARAKLSKTLSDGTQAGDSKSAAWLNIATQGSTIFAGLASWVAIEAIDFRWLLLFDALTFIICGVLIATLPVTITDGGTSKAKTKPFQGLRSLYRHGRAAAVLDLLLALVLAGTSTLDARLAEGSPTLLAGFLIAYGAAVWVAGPLAQGSWVQRWASLLWLGLGASFVALTALPGFGGLTLSIAFAKDLFYWLLLHHISGQILHRIPACESGGAHAARMAFMIITISAGDYAVGALAQVLPLALEGVWRAAVCAVAAVAVLATQRRKASLAHPSLEVPAA
jgi:hypothetical protein